MTTMKIELPPIITACCGAPEIATQLDLGEPYFQRGYAIGSNGRIMARHFIGGVPDTTGRRLPPASFFDKLERSRFSPDPLPAFTLPEALLIKCLDCSGTGVDRLECARCKGEGRFGCPHCGSHEQLCEDCFGRGWNARVPKSPCGACAGARKVEDMREGIRVTERLTLRRDLLTILVRHAARLYLPLADDPKTADQVTLPIYFDGAGFDGLVMPCRRDFGGGHRWVVKP